MNLSPEEKVSELQGWLRDALAQIKSLQAELATAQKEKQELGEQFEDYKRIVGEELDEAERERRSSIESYKESEEDAAALRSQLTEANAKLAEAQKDIGTYQRRLEKALSDLEEARLGGGK